MEKVNAPNPRSIRRARNQISFSPSELFFIMHVLLNPRTVKLTQKEEEKLYILALRLELVVCQWYKKYKLIGFTKEELRQPEKVL